MKIAGIAPLFLVGLLAIGCGTAPGPGDPGACDDPSCGAAGPPESVCLEHIAAGQADEGCGVFVSRMWGDDQNPGTRDKSVRTIARAVALARTGRGRVFVCAEPFAENITLPSGVDLIGSFDCWNNWLPKTLGGRASTSAGEDGPGVDIMPAGPGDTGAADGVSTITDMRLVNYDFYIGVRAQSNTMVEIVRCDIFGGSGLGPVSLNGTDASPEWAEDGADGKFGGDECSAAIVVGGAAVTSSCDGGVPTMGGKGGDGFATEGGDGGDGMPLLMPNPRGSGLGGTGQHGNVHCEPGAFGLDGEPGTDGAPGQGIGRFTADGEWEGGRAADGTRGAPGRGGGGGGGIRGGPLLCGTGLQGGSAGGSGGGGGCGGKGGQGGGNARPSIGVLAMHAKVTIRDTVIRTRDGGQGGRGGDPQGPGRPGRGYPGGRSPDMYRAACSGGNGGNGGMGGYGGGGRGGDVIGIAYLDEDQLVTEGVTFELGKAGKGGKSGFEAPEKSGPDGVASEKVHFSE